MAFQETLVQVEQLRKFYPVSKGLFSRATSFIHAVDDVSFQIGRGESLGLVGESGCGKTTTGKLLVKLIDHLKCLFSAFVPGATSTVQNRKESQ